MLGHKIEWEKDTLKKIGVTPEQVITIPEKLKEYFSFYQNCFNHVRQLILGLMYLTGLLSRLERKSLEPIALESTGNANVVRYLQLFITNSPWDTNKMGEMLKKRVTERIRDDDGMITFDESDFLKKGKNSAGVARQYCGVVGATNNCQAGIFMGFTGKNGYGLLEGKLYVPEKWFDEEHESLRKKCKFSKDVIYQDKCTMCLNMLKKAINDEEIKAKWIGFDSTFGVDHKLRQKISEMNLYYFANIRSTMTIWSEKPIMIASKRKGAKPRPTTKPIKVENFIKEDNNTPWIESIIGEGSKGPIITHIKLFRVYENINGTVGEEVWLFVRRYSDGELKFSFCNAPADTPCEILDEKSISRWTIEQCFEECKTELGMDHYEVRSYIGWHRHMLFVMMGHEFLCEVQNMFKNPSVSDTHQQLKFLCEKATNANNTNEYAILDVSSYKCDETKGEPDGESNNSRIGIIETGSIEIGSKVRSSSEIGSSEIANHDIEKNSNEIYRNNLEHNVCAISDNSVISLKKK